MYYIVLSSIDDLRESSIILRLKLSIVSSKNLF